MRAQTIYNKNISNKNVYDAASAEHITDS